MRTLKKTLCLVLALVMVLGLCAINAAAAFTDADEIEYTEAVGVMKAAGVIDGLPDGSFDPDGTLTRAAAAKMIACMLGYKDIAGKSEFTDMAGAEWADGYVAFCAKEGIVSGYGDGRFGPSDTLTGSQWAKMVICAMGYDAEYEGITGDTWEIAVAKKVKKLGLADNIDGFDGTQPITRQEAAELGFQGMKKPTKNYKPGVTITGVAITGEYKPDGDSLLEQLKIVPGTATADKYGRPGDTAWKSETTGKNVVNILAEPVYAADGATFKFDTNKGDFKGWTFEDGAAVIYNGGDAGTAFNTFIKGNTLNGTTVTRPGMNIEYYDTNANKKIDTIVVTEPYFAVVDKINAKTGNITLKIYEASKSGTAVTKSIAAPTTANPDASDNYTALKDFEEGAALAITMAPGWDAGSQTDEPTILDVAECTAVEGKATALKADSKYNGSVTFAGTKYTFANEYSQAAIGVKSEGKLYLAPSGYALGFAAKKTVTPETVVMFVAGFTKQVDDGYSVTTKYYAQCVSTEGEEVTYEVNGGTGPKYYDKAGDGKQELQAGTLYKVTLDTNKVATMADSSNTDTSSAAIKTTDKKIGTTDYFDKSVQFIFVEDSLADLEVTVKSGIQAVDSGVAKAYVKDATSGNITVVFVAGAPAASGSTSMLFTTANPTKTGSGLADDGDTAVDFYNVYVGGKKTEIMVETGTTMTLAEGFYKYTKADATGIVTINTTPVATGSTTGIYTADAITATTLVNVNDEYLLTVEKDATKLEDANADNADVVNTKTTGTVTSLEELAEATLSKHIWVVYDTTNKTVTTIYIVE